MGKGTILIVDDEESIRVSFREFLEDDGWVVATAADATQARRQLEDRRFDVALVDIILNGASGIDLLEAIRSRYPTTRVVMVTGVPSLDTACAALRGGAAEYLVKPLRQEQLLAAAESVLRGKAEREAREEGWRLMEMIICSLADAVIAVDARLNLLATNPAAERLCRIHGEWSKPQDPESWTRGCSGACLEPLGEVIAGGGMIRRTRQECRAQHALRQVVGLAASALRDEHGVLVGGVATISNGHLPRA